MQVGIKGLGVIAQAEIDIRPLTVFVGPNNTGKTWAAYTIASIFGRDQGRAYRLAYAAGDVSDTYPPIDAALDELLRKGNAKIDLLQFAREYGETYVNNLARFARGRLAQFMGSSIATFEQLEVSIGLQDEMDRISTFVFVNRKGVLPQFS
jgi:hypothetical protein